VLTHRFIVIISYSTGENLRNTQAAPSSRLDSENFRNTNNKGTEMQTYKELLKEAQKLNDKGFCGVIAFATLANISFKRAATKLEKAGARKHRTGTLDDGVVKVLENQGLTVDRIPVTPNTMTAHQATKRYSRGRYFVVFHGTINHHAALVNGKFNDWIDREHRGKAPRYKISKIYRVIENNA